MTASVMSIGASLSNCFVIVTKRPADSYGGIMMIDEEQVTGNEAQEEAWHDLFHIRPTGSCGFSTAPDFDGLVPFYGETFNSTRDVAQGWSQR